MILSIDHFVLNVKDLNKSIIFYKDVLGMTLNTFCPEGTKEKRHSLNFGKQKINLHQFNSPLKPHANKPR